MAKDRTVPCIHYVCAHADCQKDRDRHDDWRNNY